ncbi:MAG TPA: hypothetical protein PKM58_05360 [Pyrinomonadaceae bacterium]|nr:hypothetical protein [Pyrinomonadaceae bacterium]
MVELLALLTIGSTAGVLGLGFFLGLRHATDGDHLAAVSTIVAERKSLWSSALVGGLWGVGHTISLLIAGMIVLLLDFEISERMERALEFAVGIMLLLLGANVLRKLLTGGTLHFHSHEHGAREHAHPHIHGAKQTDPANTHHGLSFSPRSIVIGMVHGLAGSAGLMLFVVPTIESKIVGLLYIVIFGIGSIGGMMIMSFLVGLPFHLTASKFNRINTYLQLAAGIGGIVVGLSVMYEKGVTEGLLI